VRRADGANISPKKTLSEDVASAQDGVATLTDVLTSTASSQLRLPSCAASVDPADFFALEDQIRYELVPGHHDRGSHGRGQ
jgi:hypothetical protein